MNGVDALNPERTCPSNGTIDVGLGLNRSTGPTTGIFTGAVVEMPQACLLGCRCAMHALDSDAIGNDGEYVEMRLTGRENADRSVHPPWGYVGMQVTSKVAGANACGWAVAQVSPKRAGGKLSSDFHFYTLHTPSTCIVQILMKPKQASGHGVTKAAGHNKQEGEWGLRRCLDFSISG